MSRPQAKGITRDERQLELFVRTSDLVDVRSKEYRDYMRSAEWFRLRDVVLARDGYRCRWDMMVKGETCLMVDLPLEVHHFCYRQPLAAALTADLVTLCPPHHITADEMRRSYIKTTAVRTFARKKHGEFWSDRYDLNEMEDEFDFWLQTTRNRRAR